MHINDGGLYVEDGAIYTETEKPMLWQLLTVSNHCYKDLSPWCYEGSESA